MNQLFSISKLDEDEAKEIAASPFETMHKHDYEELIVGMAGEMEHFIDFKSEKFSSPFISFVTKGKLHRAKPEISEGKCSIWVIQFRSEFIPQTTFHLYSYFHTQANIRLPKGECFSQMGALCEMMFNASQDEIPNYSVIRHLLSALFVMIETERKKLENGETGFLSNQNITFKNFLKILEENFYRSEGVDFYAEKLFMSARNLNLICQNIMQQSVSEIIETRKLIEAKNLLISTDKTISEIGYELGYNEKSYFTSVFKKKSGQTPSEFREEMSKLIS